MAQPSRAPPSAAAAATAGGVIEENAMAILDNSGIKDLRDLNDDKAAFLDAVRSTCLAADSPSAPSWRMYNAVFQILRNSSSLELSVASFHLLLQLGKQYPRTYLTDSGSGPALVVVKESWSPFLLGNNTVPHDIGGNATSSDLLFDPSRFSLLFEGLVELTNAMDVQMKLKAIKNMMSFQYLVNTLEADFVPRQGACKDSLDWVTYRESLLNMLLGSRKLVFKSLVNNCMLILLNQYHHEAKDAVEDSIPSEGASTSATDLDFSLNLSFELERTRTITSLNTLFVMVMYLDCNREKADKLGLTSRADGFRNPIMEVILDELTYYNTGCLCTFLCAFVEWKWKLEIILQYFSKYCGKIAICTPRSDNSQQELNLERILGFFLTATSAKPIVRKMTSEVVQILLAHAYQACLSVQGDSSSTTATTEKIGATLLQMSCNFISAFQTLRKINPHIHISPFEKEALFTAAILKRKLKDGES